MAREPDNLVLELLRGMREDFRDVRADIHEVREDIRAIKRLQDIHTLRFDSVEERIDMLRESTMTALGFATQTGMQQKKLEKAVTELSQRVAQLEKAR